MTVQTFDIGFVSATGAIVDFYKAALGLEELEPREFPMATVRRLACGPRRAQGDDPERRRPSRFPRPRPSGSAPASATRRCGSTTSPRPSTAGGPPAAPWSWSPFELGPGTFGAMVSDPDGNAVEVMQP